MAYAPDAFNVPLFSSPGAFFTNQGQQIVLGSQDANAASASNATVVIISQANEVVHGVYSKSYYQYVVAEDGRLVQTNELATDVQDELRNAWSSGDRPEPEVIYD
jgi:hypothetical protein